MAEQPEFRRLGAKISTIDRMIEFREEELKGGNTSRGTATYYRKEIEALRMGKAALVYHQAVINGLDEPLGVLRAVVEAYEGPADEEGRLRNAVRRAKAVLEEYEQMMGVA